MSAARKFRRQFGNHAPLVLKLTRESDLAPGTVTEAVVAHDGWCRINRGKPCNCAPTVRLVPVADPQSN